MPPKREKTFTGCWTCRSRKVKCTLERPECDRCIKGGYHCTGYDIKLRWSQPVQFDKFGSQLSQTNIEPNDDETMRRRNIEPVRYNAKQAYKDYDQLDADIDGLHSYRLETGKDRDSTVIKGMFGVFRQQKRKREKDVSFSPEKLPFGSPSMFDPLSGFTQGNEWVSNELIDDALLTASAINGDTHFLDIFRADTLNPLVNTNSSSTPFYGYNADLQKIYPNPSRRDKDLSQYAPDEMFNVLFHRKEEEEPHGVHVGSDGVLIGDSNGSPLVRSSTMSASASQPISGAQQDLPPAKKMKVSIDSIQLDAPDGTSKMPGNIMEARTVPGLPQTLAIEKSGLPTTALQVNPMTRYLLNYYIEDVADMMTVIPLPKNPWKFIYFPRAIMAVGEIGSLGKTSYARSCLLNALLAVSAFNLQSRFPKNSNEMKYYVNLGIQLRQQASVFLKHCLMEDVLTQKYKDVLVAVLSMVTIDVVWGTMSDCKTHLNICERIIEKKMTVKKKLSAKALILHRIYSSMKLIQDSTNLEIVSKDEIFLNESNYKQFITSSRVDSAESNQGSRIDKLFRKSPSSLLSDSSNHVSSTSSSKGVFHEKINDQGKIRIEYIVHDQNTESPGEIPNERKDSQIPLFIDITKASFKPSKNKLDDHDISSDAIYGLPNSLILLFSEVVHLIRFKVYCDSTSTQLPLFFKLLADELSTKLSDWKLEWKLTTQEDSKKFISARHEGIYHHVMSFYHGLVIYFYRFIEDINPNYLQEYVEKVLVHLNRIQEIVQSDKDILIIPLFWQGFIAGSEAMTVYLQNGFKKWGTDISKTGIGTYWVARQIMLEVWRRKNFNEKKSNWIDVIRDWDMNVMLT
ncbi:hypothetical protein LJB42_001413 [Komagataella kurtzmanii]|nr:hypothetical protein LJB42_001413 [Komagataella kurtzmanii]